MPAPSAVTSNITSCTIIKVETIGATDFDKVPDVPLFPFSDLINDHSETLAEFVNVTENRILVAYIRPGNKYIFRLS